MMVCCREKVFVDRVPARWKFHRGIGVCGVVSALRAERWWRFYSDALGCFFSVMSHNTRDWLMDSSVAKRLDKKWRTKVQKAVSPTRGVLLDFVKFVVQGFLRERTWSVDGAFRWVREFMAIVGACPRFPQGPGNHD